ncbi:ornithine cyclodeaminase family protein [Gulosibacter bifidus]|uniref:Ornithine cyclodeaminase family protein n=1 Tax=Gulosibacter bifidus TaxID=272239 RepID=A0ABW5RH87_9MICO|nr:ornithine cyclodeaminase family protein [Gulosibacter bifidus]
MKDERTAMNATPRWSAEQVRAAMLPDCARKLIESVLRSGFDPATDPARMNTQAGAGVLLLMPSTIGDWTGIKVASVSSANPDRGLPRIQGPYLLLDSTTLSLRLIADTVSLTELRTPAVSAVAIDRLAATDAQRLVVFGTGPQAIGHVIVAALLRPFDEILIVGRRTEKVADAVEQLAQAGVTASAGQVDDVATADVVICATSAPTPLFDGGLVRDGTVVIAIGSHEPDKRELDSALMSRALVVVEDAQTAVREAGDVAIPVNGLTCGQFARGAC